MKPSINDTVDISMLYGNDLARDMIYDAADIREPSHATNITLVRETSDWKQIGFNWICPDNNLATNASIEILFRRGKLRIEIKNICKMKRG